MGALDERLSERPQLKADLTLKQAVEISRLHEIRKEVEMWSGVTLKKWARNVSDAVPREK